VESCSAAVEHFDGRLEIVSWKPDAVRELTGAAITEARAA
jgi:hypothetical protein